MKKKIVLFLLLISITAQLFLCVSSVNADSEKTLRIAGQGRYETSIKIAEELKMFQGVDKFDTVILATGKNYADALGGGYLAAKKNAPILLTSDAKYFDVNYYIRNNLKPNGKVYVLGGEGAVSKTCLTGLENFDVERLAGKNRYNTNMAILNEAGVSNEDILVCTGANYADSLTASASGKPMLLVNKSLNAEQKDFLADHAGNKLYIIGGTGAVSAEIENELLSYGAVERVAGSSRYQTSIQIAEKFCNDPPAAVLAYSNDYPDGLCAGPLAYTLGAPILLLKPGYEGAARDYVALHSIEFGIVSGGEARIPAESVDIVFPPSAVPEPPTPSDKIKIAFCANGTLGDKSFFDSGAEGMNKINRDFGDRVQAMTFEFTYDDSTWYQQLDNLFESKEYDIIIVGTYDMLRYAVPLSSQYPDQKVWFYEEVWDFDANPRENVPPPGRGRSSRPSTG